MADLEKNTLLDDNEIITTKHIENFKTVSLRDNDFILYSQAENRYSVCHINSNDVKPKDGDFAIFYNPTRVLTFINNAWFELATGDDGINPPGTVIPIASNNIPSGYLICDGREISRNTYYKLFRNIQTIYGSGNGSTTFNIPDTRGLFIRGWDHGRNVDRNRAIGSYQDSMFKSHSHSGKTNWNDGHNHYFINGPFGLEGSRDYSDDERGSGDSPSGTWTSEEGEHSHDFTTNNSGGADTYPNNIAMVFCIRI